MTEEAQRQSIEYLRRGTFYTMRLLLNQLIKIHQARVQNKQNLMTKIKAGENEYNVLEAQRKNLSKFELAPAIADQELNFNKLKAWLAERDVEFAVKDMKDGGKLIAFNYRDTDLVREQIKKIIDNIRNKPEEVIKDIGKTPADKTFEEEIAQAKVRQRDDVAESRGIKLAPEDSSITVEDILRAEEAAKQKHSQKVTSSSNEQRTSKATSNISAQDKLNQHFEAHPPTPDEAYFNGLMENIPEEVGKGIHR